MYCSRFRRSEVTVMEASGGNPVRRCSDATHSELDIRLRALLSEERLEQQNFWPAFLDASARMRALPTQQQEATQLHHRHARVGGHPVLNSSLRGIFCWIPASAGMTMVQYIVACCSVGNSVIYVETWRKLG
jgi:hypothetical protein